MLELKQKYKLELSTQQWLFVEKVGDLIEFSFDDLDTRLVTHVRIYDVKTVRQQVFAPDLSFVSHNYYTRIATTGLATVYFAVVIPKATWDFEWTLVPFGSAKPHLHMDVRKKRLKERIYSREKHGDSVSNQ